eukprot:7215351-Alexandrium_andersonii.AAC.2
MCFLPPVVFSASRNRAASQKRHRRKGAFRVAGWHGKVRRKTQGSSASYAAGGARLPRRRRPPALLHPAGRPGQKWLGIFRRRAWHFWKASCLASGTPSSVTSALDVGHGSPHRSSTHSPACRQQNC